MSVQSIEEFNRSNALTHFNRSVSVFVWVLGLGALVSSVLPVTLPWLGMLDGGGLNNRINNFIVQLGLLLLFVNTNNVYEYYVIKLRYSLKCALTGSAVYLAHLVSVILCFRKPLLWLWCVSGIMMLRTLATMQLYTFIRKTATDHPWADMLRTWSRHSFLYLLYVLPAAALIQLLSSARFYSWAHGIPLDTLATSSIGQTLLKDIQTVLLLVVAHQMATRAFQRVEMSPKFAKEEIDHRYKQLKADDSNSSLSS